ncbi:MAG: S8 family serine peptidase [Deltaproteobacteria bacterium]|jgi:hypothetical protein
MSAPHALRFRVVLAALLAGACTQSAEPVASTQDAVSTAAPLRVGVKATSASACPAPLASVGGEWVPMPALPFPLDRFCSYAWTTPTGAPEDAASLDNLGLQGVEEADEGLVASMSGPQGASTSLDLGGLVTSMRTSLFSAFASRLELPAAPVVTSAAPVVRIALVDTAPNGTGPTNSPHARELEALAQDIICSAGAGCAAEIERHLGLPRLQGGAVDLVRGGYFGTLLDVARGIVEATNAAASSTPQPWILNLSLGWEDAKMDADLPASYFDLVTQDDAATKQVPAPVRAVLTALTYARCHGALIVAAAGNDPVGRGLSTGPTYPAGWSALPAPTVAQCTAAFGVAHHAGVGPLLVAASGLADGYKPAPNQRTGARAELNTPATAVIATTGRHVLTGSSIAALTVSAVAATVWAVNPSWGPHDVYDHLYGSARPMGVAAELCGPNGCGGARVISACLAQQKACTVTGNCPASTCNLAPTNAWTAAMFQAGRDALLEGGGTFGSLAGVFTSTASFGGSCGAAEFLAVPGAECPYDEPPAFENQSSGPQPGTPICPACYVTYLGGEIYVHLWLSEEIPGNQVFAPMVVVEDDRERRKYVLTGPLPPGASAILHLGNPGMAPQLTRAHFVYELEENAKRYLAAEPILIEQ